MSPWSQVRPAPKTYACHEVDIQKAESVVSNIDNACNPNT